MAARRPLLAARLVVAAGSTGCGLAVAPACVGRPAPAPDVLVVVMDTVRADALGSGGSGRDSSPRVDALAAEGVRFTDVTSPASWTWPGHASLFTGRPPWEHGARHHPGDDPEVVVTALRADLPTFAERLAAAGYQSAALSANGWLHAEMGLTRGFQQVEILHSDGAVVQRAEEWIQAPGPGTPRLLLVNLMGAHAPWAPSPAPWTAPLGEALTAAPPAWAAPYIAADPVRLDLYRIPPGSAQSGFESYMTGQLAIPDEGLQLVEDLYEGNVAAADHAAGRIAAAWRAAHPDGVVVITSDHGEYLGEHGLLEHGLTAWPEVLEVPLVIVAPGRLPAGQVVHTPVQLHDVAGTIEALAGLEPTSRSLLPIIEGEARPGPILAAAWRHVAPARRMGGVFTRDWFYLRDGDRVLVADSTGGASLHTRGPDGALTPVNDPAGLATALAAHRADLAAMQAPAMATGSGLGAPGEAEPGVAIPATVRDRLEALGYVEAPSP